MLFRSRRVSTSHDRDDDRSYNGFGLVNSIRPFTGISCGNFQCRLAFPNKVTLSSVSQSVVWQDMKDSIQLFQGADT